MTQPLTARQRDVLALLVQGQTCAEAAVTLGLAPDTVKRHAEDVRARLGARNMVQAAYVAGQRGWFGEQAR